MAISPIDKPMQERVSNEVQRYIHLAASLYGKTFESIDVSFDLKGRTAGMYRCQYKKVNKQQGYLFSFPNLFAFGGASSTAVRQIRFNPWLFSKYPEDSWSNTIPHEVAHYISDCLYGLSNIKPHGREWQSIMHDFEAEPLVRGDYSLEGIPHKKIRRFIYRCACREVKLTTYRHKKIQHGEQEYRCRDCKTPLVLNE